MRIDEALAGAAFRLARASGCRSSPQYGHLYDKGSYGLA